MPMLLLSKTAEHNTGSALERKGPFVSTYWLEEEGGLSDFTCIFSYLFEAYGSFLLKSITQTILVKDNLHLYLHNCAILK